MNSDIKYIKNPSMDYPGNCLEAFLEKLNGPVWIELDGRQEGFCRSVSTLLHGNEPSGLKAIYTLLKEGFRPLFQTHLLVISVHAARTLPLFSHRSLPGHRDINRCFHGPFDNQEGQLAAEILQILQSRAPQYHLDIHNTSSSGPAFGVSIGDAPVNKALVSLFTDRCIFSDIRMGALMEIDSPQLPVVTIECGGASDAAADQLAYEGLKRFLSQDEILLDASLIVHRNPIRLELNGHACVAYGEEAFPNMELTIRQDIEQYNYQPTPAGVFLGWIHDDWQGILRAIDPLTGNNKVKDAFVVMDNKLYTKVDLQLFMATTISDIAQSDCLFYFCEI